MEAITLDPMIRAAAILMESHIEDTALWILLEDLELSPPSDEEFQSVPAELRQACQQVAAGRPVGSLDEAVQRAKPFLPLLRERMQTQCEVIEMFLQHKLTTDYSIAALAVRALPLWGLKQG